MFHLRCAFFLKVAKALATVAWQIIIATILGRSARRTVKNPLPKTELLRELHLLFLYLSEVMTRDVRKDS
jgi:hypothetical protein